MIASLQSEASQKHLYYICTMLDQRRRRWAGVVQIIYKCFVFAGMRLAKNIERFLLIPIYH